METVGTLRSNSPQVETAIQNLEDASLDSEPDFNTEIAVLNKINAASVIAAICGGARIHSRCGLIFHVAARIAAVMRPVMSAPIGTASASAPVAAHPIEENASGAVNSPRQIQAMDEVADLRHSSTARRDAVAIALLTGNGAFGCIDRDACVQ